MKRRPHASWLIAAGSVGVVFGAVIALWAREFDVDFKFLVFIAGALLLGGILSKSRYAITLLFTAGLLFGGWRGASVLQSYHVYDQWQESVVNATGRISEDPEYTEKGVQLKLDKVVINGVETSGVIWSRIPNSNELKRSYEVTLKGKLSDGFGTIPASMFDAKLSTVNKTKYKDRGRDLRDWFSNGISRSIKGNEAQLASGILVGQKSALPEALKQELLLLGLSHIVVASGYNLTILVKAARKVFLRVSRFAALAASGLLIIGFLSITGLSPSMVRASLVAILSLLAWYYGRKMHPVVILSIAGGLTVGFNPTYAWGDLGWMLSFLSFAGVLILAPLLDAYFWGQKQPGLLRGVLIETISAQVMTLPLLAYTLGQYSPLSLVANILVVPFIPYVMALIVVAGIAGVSIAPIAWLFGIPGYLVLLYFTHVAETLARLPIASQEVQVSVGAMGVGYFSIIGAVLWIWKQTGYNFHDRSDEWI